MCILCITDSISVEISFTGKQNFHVKLLVSQMPVAKLYTCSVISMLQNLVRLHVKGVQTNVVEDSPHLHPPSTNLTRLDVL
jgi:hypothetical protein